MSASRIQGTVLKYPDADINTDVIWPGKYTYVQLPPAEMPKHAMETFDPGFAAKAREHSVLVVGKNFGCGSSREQASECLKHAGIRAIVAPSFSRIFYRNSINLGLPVLESAEAFAALETGDAVELDLEEGWLVAGARRFTLPRYPEFILGIIRDGGLIEHIREADRREADRREVDRRDAERRAGGEA